MLKQLENSITRRKLKDLKIVRPWEVRLDIEYAEEFLEFYISIYKTEEVSFTCICISPLLPEKMLMPIDSLILMMR